MPARILIVAPNLLYGDPNPRSIRARHVASGLAGRGWDVEVATWWSGAEPRPAEPDWLGGARLRAIAAPSPFANWDRAAAPSGGEAAETEGEALAPWGEAVWAELERLPGAERPELVHAIGVPVGAIVAGARIAGALGAPLIADLGDPWPAPSPAAAAERGEALRGAAALVTTTPALAERLGAELRPGTPIELIPNGGEVRRRPEGPAPEPPLFVHMGAINPGRADPLPAFAALGSLHRAGEIEFRSHSVGFIDGFAELPHPHLPLLAHAEALELSANAAGALVLGNADPAQLPSKAFEIACTETWALCVRGSDADPAAELLERSGHAVVAAANEPAAIRAAAEEILARERRGERPEPDQAQSWSGRIDALEGLLEGLTGQAS